MLLYGQVVISLMVKIIIIIADIERDRTSGCRGTTADDRVSAAAARQSAQSELHRLAARERQTRVVRKALWCSYGNGNSCRIQHQGAAP